MPEQTILLNGGSDHEVVLLEGADPFLVRLLGQDESRPAVPFLRALQDAEGRQRVGVVVGEQHVGYLTPGSDEAILATIKACELNGALARARGNLVASCENPGKVSLRVSLAEPDYLLCEPAPAPAPAIAPADLLQADSTERLGVVPGAADLLTSSLDEAWEPRGTAAGLDSTADPSLSSGWTEDYPDWPPPKPKDLVAASPAPLSGPTAPAAALTPSEPLEPVVPSEPPLAFAPSEPPAPLPVSPIPVETVEKPAMIALVSPPAPTVDQSSQPSSQPSPQPSLQALLATRGAWLGAAPPAAEAQGAGWLASAAGASQALNAAPTQSAAPSTSPSWQGMTQHAPATKEDRLDPVGEIVAAWNSTPAARPSASSAEPIARSGGKRQWLLAALAVVAIAVAAVLVWKFAFAPKTYTDEEYGYSFQYPGRWELANETAMFTGFASQAPTASVLSMAAAGYGMGDVSQPEEFAAVGIVLFSADPQIVQSEMQSMLDSNMSDAEAAAAGMSIIEPLRAVTVGGLPGYQTSLSMSVGAFSVNATLCLVAEEGTLYMLMAMSKSEDWQGNQKAFDRFFDSFKPGVPKT